MQAGRELDALVAKHVMDLNPTWNIPNEDYFYTVNGSNNYLPYYSTSISGAWQVVEKLKGPDMWIGIDTTPDGRYRCMMLNKKGPDADFIADSAPRAICLAALKAVGVDIEKAV